MQINEILPQEFFLKPGYVVAHSDETLVRCVLGSCVAVALYDRANQIGGMNHFIWPRCEDPTRANVTYGNVAMRALWKVLKDMGAHRNCIEAQIFGGGVPPEHFGQGGVNLGEDNLESARDMLKRMGVPIVSEDVGGCKGRKVIYNTLSNEAMVMKVDRLRATDWFEYGQDVDWTRV